MTKLEPNISVSVNDFGHIFSEVSNNAWYGFTPHNVFLQNPDGNVINISGHSIETGYENYSSTADIIENGERIYAKDSRCVEAYHVEVVSVGKFAEYNDCIAYLKEKYADTQFTLFFSEKDLSIPQERGAMEL